MRKLFSLELAITIPIHDNQISGRDFINWEIIMLSMRQSSDEDPRTENCQALVPNPKPIRPQSLQTQSQPSPTQFETQINPKGTGADTKIL